MLIPPGQSITVSTVTIQVSGYATLYALAVVCGSREIGRCAMNDPALVALQRDTVGTGVRRCWGCREQVPWFRHQPPTPIGLPGLCDQCVDTHRRECLVRAGRLPGDGEFWCRLCGHLQPLAALCPPDADGRRRWACRSCRREQTRRADARRRTHRRLHGVVGIRL